MNKIILQSEAEKLQETVDIVREAIRDWNGGSGILSDAAALFVISSIVNPVEPTEEDKKWADEIFKNRERDKLMEEVDFAIKNLDKGV